MNKPTEEQQHILDLALTTNNNIMVDALAGVGKTTMIEMVEQAIETKPLLYLVFNKRNADEATKRMLSTTTVRTFNGCGHRIWSKACGKNLTLDSKKTQTILRSIINDLPKKDQGPVWESFWDIVHGVGMAKALGYVPDGKYPNARRLTTQSSFHAALDETPDDLSSDLIDYVLTKSIKMGYDGIVDFNDQIYLPALFGGVFPRFPFIAVDEYQDLNPVNHALLDKLVQHRLFGVGDPNQNIYNFRGAKLAGMAEAKAKYEMTTCDLSVSFRCPEAIVLNARWRVPHFKWIKEGGHVEVLKSTDSFPESSTILCRNNAPLFRCALQLLSTGRSVSVAGSDIGPKLLGIMRKLGPEDMGQPSVLSSIEDWLAVKLDRGSTTAQDLADCMKVFASQGSTLGQAIAYAEHLFAQKGTIRLMTGHKAKGLEFPTVYFLDPWLCKDTEQDLNLKYVIETRAMERLYYINSRDIRWN